MGAPLTVSLTPVSAVRMVGKQYIKIIVTSVLLTIVGLITVYLLPDVYRAETLILVEQQKIPERLVESTVQVELQDRLATISQQILSGTQLQKIIDKHNLFKAQRNKISPEQLIENMRKDIDIKTEKGWSRNRPGAFRVYFSSTDPQQAALVAGEISNLFIEENLKSREVQASGATEFLGSQLEEAKKRLLEQEAKLSEFKRKNTGQLPGQENTLLMALTQLQTQSIAANEALSRAHGAKTMLESDLRAAELALQRAAQVVAAEQTALQAQQAQQQQAAANPASAAANKDEKTPPRSEQLEQLLDQLKRRYTDQHPQVRALQAEIIRVRAQEQKDKERELAARRPNQPAAAKPGSDAPPQISAQSVTLLEQSRDRVEKLKAQLSLANQEIAAKEQDKARIDAELNRQQSALSRLPVAEQEMISVTRDYEVSKKTYETLLQRSYTAATAEDLERRQKSERFTLLDPARPPEKPSSPNRPALYGIVTAVSLLCGLAFGIGWEYKKNVVLGEWELPADVWLLGRIPDMDMSGETARKVSQRKRRRSESEATVPSITTVG